MVPVQQQSHHFGWMAFEASGRRAVWVSQGPGHREGSLRLAPRWSWLLLLPPVTLLLSLTHETLEKVSRLYLCFLQSPSQLLSLHKSEQENPKTGRNSWLNVFGFGACPPPLLACLPSTTQVCHGHVGKPAAELMAPSLNYPYVICLTSFISFALVLHWCKDWHFCLFP